MAADLDSLLATQMTEPIDLTQVNSILASPPFVTISGTFNARRLLDHSQSAIRSDYIFRSGSLEHLTTEGQSALRNLGITTIFDLRSQREKETVPTPDIPGIENKWYPSTATNSTTASARESEKSEETISLTGMYLDILETHQPSFKAVFQHIRDHPDMPFLFHCTAGKDRTGVLAALILSVADADLETINRDYALTRIGIEPVRELLTAKLTAGNLNTKLNSPRMREYAKLPLDCWDVVFTELGKRYGDVKGYIKQELGLSGEEMNTIVANLRIT
ncbi:hypothetical protein LTR05_001543 [Lithohypha guttulata]|uniref:Tyrosine specific protein phosphatases domain-containing protein n=1 Tax=Lithohypha guttulata TaxID=1690604 RepID=A0AAN7T7X7_9EURO|nr:hypothetical protein LTR05_001543 [Lithohypha guttulata]